MKRTLIRLTRLFPAAFRAEFGAEMVEQIELDYENARTRGVLPAFAFALLTAIDVAWSGLAERVNPTMTFPQATLTEGKGMLDRIFEWTGDFRHALRRLKRSPGFTVVTVGTLGLAIGVTAGMFSVVDTVILKPLPYANIDRIVYVAATAPGSQFPAEFGVSSEFYVHYKERSRLLEGVALVNSYTNTLRVGDRVERVRMSSPTYTLFTTLGARPILGRLPVAEDEARVVVISHALWQSWFGGDSSVVGKSVQLSGDTRTVIGVMGAEFRYPRDDVLLWLSGDVRAEGIQPGRFGAGMIARMKPGVTPDALARELTALSRELPGRFGGTANYARVMAQHRAIVRPLEEQLLGSVARPLWILLGAVGIVLLIACANVANLFMVRAEGRQRELAVRRAIGAGRGQLIRLQMTEALFVAGLAGVVAAVLARATLPMFVAAAPPGIPRLADVGMGLTPLLFTLGVALLAAVACGLAPAVGASEPDLAKLREGGRGSTRRRHWVRDGLVVGQTALALVLLISSGLLIRSFSKLSNVHPGYDTKDLFTFQIAPENAALRDGPTFARFHLAFMDRLRALPGVQSVGIVENIPLNEGTAEAAFLSDEAAGNSDAGTRLHYTFAGPDYFKTMGIAVRSGRPLTIEDNFTTRGNVLISRSAAHLLWPDKDPVGRRLQRAGATSWGTVVGVVDDVMQDNFRDTPDPLVYFPMVGPTDTSWALPSPAYVVKTPRAEFIAPEIRALVHEIAPEAPMYRTFTMAGLAKDSKVQLSFTMLTLGIASVLALILGTVGLYGVLSYVVAQRTREIGVRMALGAEAGRVMRMVIAQGARVVGLGVVIGIGVALASTRALGSLLFGVDAMDVTTFVVMSALLVAVGVFASYMPARRASNVDPIESLRGD